MSRGVAVLWRWLGVAEWRAHRMRQSLAVIAIAIGVALGFAVQLINTSAVETFEAATRSSSGSADLELRARGLDTSSGFDDRLLDQVYALEGVADASAVLTFDAIAQSVASADAASRQPSVAVLGVDAFRVARVTPSLIARPAGDPALAQAADAAWLSSAALEAIGVLPGQRFVLTRGADRHAFVVAGTLDAGAPGRPLVAIDIAAAQSWFGRVGKLDRIDIRLAEGWTPQRFRQQWTPPINTMLTDPAGATPGTADPSRAYRTNLGVLALIALITGAFLVYSILSLSIASRRSQFALLRALGATRSMVVAQVLAEAALIGIAGALLGVGGGAALATLVLHLLGADLGGGYFASGRTALAWSTPQAVGYFALGVAAALAGSFGPAREIARLPAVQALKSGTDLLAVGASGSPWIAVTAWLLALACALMPPVGELPVFGYAAVALLLFGGIAGIPWLAARIGQWVRQRAAGGRSAVRLLAASHVERAPGQAQVLLAGVIASFSLMVAMGIMVTSFRHSLGDWLDTVLPADLYLRAEMAGTRTLDDELQRRVEATPGIARLEWARSRSIILDPARPPVLLQARPMSTQGVALPIVEGPVPVGDAVAVHVSQAMVDLYHLHPGDRLSLPGSPPIDAVVASVWRDYAYQFGSIVIDLETYRRLTGDLAVTGARVWLSSEADPSAVTAALTAAGVPGVASAIELRRRSLQIFDRSFAITYALEAVAIAIGLAGIAATVATQALSRAREFGMLRHLGIRRRDILALVMAEVALLTLVASIGGLVLGVAISHVLVDVVNPQSFHWTMDFHLPVGLLLAVSAVLLASAVATAVIAGRRAASGSAIAAVRQDW
ncbi:FtsX-like permease family protein [soil metagenome]